MNLSPSRRTFELRNKQCEDSLISACCSNLVARCLFVNLLQLVRFFVCIGSSGMCQAYACATPVHCSDHYYTTEVFVAAKASVILCSFRVVMPANGLRVTTWKLQYIFLYVPCSKDEV